MGEDYKIETLVETFKRHYAEALKLNEEIKIKRKEYDPEWEPHEGYDFCVSMALHVICKEIVELKRKLSLKK